MRFAFTGAGYIANIHAQAAQKLPEVQMVAVVEIYSDKAQSFAERFGVRCCYTTVEELL
jgi:predicted dehydrogenase